MLKTVFGGLRTVAGQKVEQVDARLPIEAMKSSVNTIADVSRQYERYSGKVAGPRQVRCKAL